MKRVLHIAGSMSPSGIGNYIMNVYRHIDREKLQFDFLLCEKRQVSFDEEIEALGGRIHYITRKSVSPVKNFLETMTIVRREGYDTVFRHTDTATVALDLLAARLGGARQLIPHSHSTSTGNIRMHRLFQPLLNAVSTRRFACSPRAGDWLYGPGHSFDFVKNAIDLEEFTYKSSIGDELKAGLGLSPDTLLIGHVGNLLPVKNHLFLLDLLADLRQGGLDAVLLFVGDGEMRPQIETRARELGVEDHLLLVGVRNDIADLLSAMDIFAFPSFYEGLPIALVEAQAEGLPCLMSENITGDVDVLPQLLFRLPVSREPGPDQLKAWAAAVGEARSHRREPADREAFAATGFDIREMVKVYEDL